MSAREFREFEPGDEVSILDDRRESWQPSGPLTVVAVSDNHFSRGRGHPQLLLMSDGDEYSGWWFDKNCECPLA